MEKKVAGVVTPILTVVFGIVMAIVVGLANNSSDGWAALGALIIVFMLTGVVLIIMLVVALILYVRNKSDYALGVLYGLAGIFVLGLFGSILGAIF